MDLPLQVIATTRPDYVRQVADETTRGRLRLAMIRNRSRILTNQSGTKCVYPIKYSKPPTQGWTSGMPIEYGNHNAWRQIELSWRGLVNPDSMDLMQFMMNTGAQQIINLFQDKSNNIFDGIQEDFHEVMITAGDSLKPDGLETFLTYTACGAADTVATPNDTYGDTSLSTVLGALGGSWSDSGANYPNATLANDWPNGQGSREYTANSPLFLNFASTGWNTGDSTWETNCWRVISQGITWLTVNGGKEGVPTNVCLAKDLWNGYKNHHESIRRITIPHQEAQDLGFGNSTLNHDGTAIHTEFDIPAGRGYIENMNHVELSSLAPDLFWMIHSAESVGGQLQNFMNMLNMNTLGLNMLGGFFGQFRYRPRHVGRIADHTS